MHWSKGMVYDLNVDWKPKDKVNLLKKYQRTRIIVKGIIVKQTPAEIQFPFIWIVTTIQGPATQGTDTDYKNKRKRQGGDMRQEREVVGKKQGNILPIFVRYSVHMFKSGRKRKKILSLFMFTKRVCLVSKTMPRK